MRIGKRAAGGENKKNIPAFGGDIREAQERIWHYNSRTHKGCDGL